MDIEIDVELLIHAVEQRPGLWDLSDPAYANRDQRKASWDEVCNVFASDGDNSLQDKRNIGKVYCSFKENLRQFYWDTFS